MWQNTASQTLSKRPMQQMQPGAPRNSNLRELPIAPPHVLELSNSRCPSTPAAHVKPMVNTSPPTRPGPGSRSAQGKAEVQVKPASPGLQPKEEAAAEPEVGLWCYSCVASTRKASRSPDPTRCHPVFPLSRWVLLT